MQASIAKMIRSSKAFYGWVSSDSSGDSDGTLASKVLSRKRHGPRHHALPRYDSRRRLIHWRPNKPPPPPSRWQIECDKRRAGVPTAVDRWLMCLEGHASLPPHGPDELSLDYLYVGLGVDGLFKNDVVQCSFHTEVYQHLDKGSPWADPTTWTLRVSVYVPPSSGFLVYVARSPQVVLASYTGDEDDRALPNWVETCKQSMVRWLPRSMVVDFVRAHALAEVNGNVREEAMWWANAISRGSFADMIGNGRPLITISPGSSRPPSIPAPSPAKEEDIHQRAIRRRRALRARMEYHASPLKGVAPKQPAKPLSASTEEVIL